MKHLLWKTQFTVNKVVFFSNLFSFFELAGFTSRYTSKTKMSAPKQHSGTGAPLLTDAEFVNINNDLIPKFDQIENNAPTTSAMTERHVLVQIKDKRKPANVKMRECRYCSRNNIKTKKGWNVKTQLKCSACDVPLCSGSVSRRNCFVLYHNKFYPGMQ